MKAKKIKLKPTPEDISKPGDYCIVENFGSTDDKVKPHRAMIVCCPFDGIPMATTQAHYIREKRGVASWLFTLFGFKRGIDVGPMLQCPYHPSHKFKIENNKIIAL